MSGLRVIQFSAEDYRIADVLSRPNLEQIQDPTKISAAVSLYFQWPEHRQAFIKFDGQEYQPVELSVDSDLAVPDELFVNFSQKIKADISKPVRIRFEIFKTCFEYSTAVLADLSADFDFTSLVIPIPTELYVHKARTSPRYGVPLEHPLRKITFTDSKETYPCELKNVSVKSLLVSGLPEHCVAGKLQLGQNYFEAEQIKDTQFGKVFKLNFPTHKEYGAFFDCFIRIAYPNLRPRYQFDHDTIYNLYVETGYLSRFGETVVNPNDPNSITEEERKRRIIEYWKESEKDEHDYKVDYVLVDENEKPIGASGLAKIFKEESGSFIWAPHQLCAVKNPKYLNGTASLYRWYVEYLDGLDINFLTWYRSASKWNERLYTKLSLANTDTKLTPVHLKRVITTNSKQLDIASLQRNYFNIEDVLVGSNPEYLNASRLFELIWARSDKTTTQQIDEAIKVYNSSCGQKAGREFRVSIPQSSALLGNFESRPTDRTFEMPTSAYSDFLNTVEHSITLTRRKNEL